MFLPYYYLRSPSKAVTYALASEHEYQSAGALAALARTLPKRLLHEAFQVAKAMTIEEARATALTRLAPRLAQLGHATDALDAIRNVKRPSLRAGLLGPLASVLPQTQQSSLLLEAVEMALAIEAVDERARALQGLASYLTEELLVRALEAARAIPHERRRGDSLVKFAAQMARLGDTQKALETAPIVDPLSRANALAQWPLICHWS